MLVKMLAKALTKLVLMLLSMSLGVAMADCNAGMPTEDEVRTPATPDDSVRREAIVDGIQGLASAKRTLGHKDIKHGWVSAPRWRRSSVAGLCRARIIFSIGV